MFTVYVLQLPWNFHPRTLGFASRSKAEETLNAFCNHISASASFDFKITEFDIFEDSDIKEKISFSTKDCTTHARAPAPLGK